MVDFFIGQIYQNRPYTKLTISQKLKIAQKKTHELKNPFQNIIMNKIDINPKNKNCKKQSCLSFLNKYENGSF